MLSKLAKPEQLNVQQMQIPSGDLTRIQNRVSISMNA